MYLLKFSNKKIKNKIGISCTSFNTVKRKPKVYINYRVYKLSVEKKNILFFEKH